MRESVPKGAGLTSHTVGVHVKNGGLVVGEFIDDRLGLGAHANGKKIPINAGSYSLGVGSVKIVAGDNSDIDARSIQVRAGLTTEVKAIGVNYIIKAI